MQAAPAPSPAAQVARDKLAAWAGPQALRRDGNGDGTYESAEAIGLMDVWWEPMIRAMYDGALGDVGARSAQGFHNAPSSTGSAFQGGFYGQVWTDLAQALGMPLKSPTSQIYCGSPAVGTSGSKAACAQKLWASLAAVADAAPADAEAERILFLPTAALSMHWVNRPTTQHIAMFGRLPVKGLRPPVTAPPASNPGGGLAATGLAPWVPAAGLVLLLTMLLRRRRA